MFHAGRAPEPERGYVAACAGPPGQQPSAHHAPGQRVAFSTAAAPGNAADGYPKPAVHSMSAGDDDVAGRNGRGFGERVAQSPTDLCNGEKPKAWAKFVRNYLMGWRYEMKDLLVWAESFQEETITMVTLEAYSASGPHTQDTGFSAVRASQQFWTFLSLNVGRTGDGRTKFDQAAELNGLDVWRRIVT